jgi:NitT/TauT family transport system substrate-binding protein
VNLGAILYANTQGAVQLLAVNTLGVIYVVEKGGQTVTDWESLRGQTIYATGKGSTPEYALTYLLEQNGLDPDTDVTIEWKSEPTEIVALMAAQDHVIALMPQPYVTVAQSKFDDLTVALDLTQAWDDLDNGSQLNTAGLVVRTEFAQEHPQAVAAFLAEYAASTAYVNENVADAAQLVGQYDIVDAAVAEKAIPYCNIVCITGEEMKTSVQGFFQVLFDQNPQAVGGELPGDDFYYTAEG